MTVNCWRLTLAVTAWTDPFDDPIIVDRRYATRRRSAEDRLTSCDSWRYLSAWATGFQLTELENLDGRSV